MLQSFFYVAQGKIHLKEGDKPARLIESKFGQSLVDRASQIQKRNAWKTEGTGARFMSGRMLWAGQLDQDNGIPIVINAISRCNGQGEVLYSLSTSEIGGVFSITRNGAERRLLHTADFRVGHLSANPSDHKIACVVRTKGGSHLAVMQGDGRELTDVTQGDSMDVCPNWVPGSTNELVFQTSDIGRDAAGKPAGSSPARVEKLNLETGDIVTLLGDETHDYVDPKMDAAGNLYCIRKPYVSPRASFDPLRAALDLVLLPFRLLFALFQFVNFFTMRYTGNTLVSSGSARQRQMDLRHMMIMDNLAQAMRAPELFVGPNKDWIAPRSWSLVRKTNAGEIEVLEKGVFTFDLAENGIVLFTDGKRVVQRNKDGAKKELLRDQFISQVLV